MKTEALQIRASDGKQLHLYCWLPDAGPYRAAIQIAHGMGEHAARYEVVAKALCEQGYAVYANDHRGHGQTASGEEEFGQLGPDGWKRCVLDLRELNQEIRQRHPGLPIVLLGHSMGSFLAQLYLTDHAETLAGAVLSGSTAAGRGLRIAQLLARFERWRLGPDAQSPVLDKALFGRLNETFKNPRTDFDWLSRDASEVDKYIADPMCGFVLRVQSLIDMFDGGKLSARPENQAKIPADLPLYIFSGDQDPVNNKLKGLKKLIRSYERAGLRQIVHRFYSDGRHEMFNETNRAEVIHDLLQWLDENIKPSHA